MATEITYDPKPLTASQLQTLPQEVKLALTELYGNRLDRVILYGSYARGDFHKESDVDYMVVLKEEDIKWGKELRDMVDVTYDLCDQYGVVISLKPTSLAKYEQSDLFFYRNVRREGQLV